MTPPETRNALIALRTDHAYIAVRPADATPAEAPAFLVEQHTVQSLDYAWAEARDRWPECPRWAIIASDELLHLKDPTWPPTLRALRSPITLTTFAA